MLSPLMFESPHCSLCLVHNVFQLGRNIAVETNRRGRIRIQYGIEISAEVSPWNGNVPVAISYSTAPKENRSVRPSSPLPLACSGDMWATVPSADPD